MWTEVFDSFEFWLALISTVVVFVVSFAIYPHLVLAVSDTDLMFGRNFITSQRRSSKAKRQQNVLLVTAHPDDETMFFGPTIVRILSDNANNVDDIWKVHLLCLSSGDAYGEGDRRRRELIEASSRLGLSGVKIVDDPSLRDGHGKQWSRELIADYIHSELILTRAHWLMTFDEQGVSSHCDHIAIADAVRQSIVKLTESDVLVFQLHSVMLIRKYLSFIGAALTLIVSGICVKPLFYILWRLATTVGLGDVVRRRRPITFALSASEFVKVHRALRAHKSQMVWFRKIYSYTSAYMFINTLYPLN